MFDFTGDLWKINPNNSVLVILAAHQDKAKEDIEIAVLNNLNGAEKANASLIASAPDMYRLIYKLANTHEVNPSVIKILSAQAKQLLDYIERNEVLQHDGDTQ